MSLNMLKPQTISFQRDMHLAFQHIFQYTPVANLQVQKDYITKENPSNFPLVLHMKIIFSVWSLLNDSQE